MATAEIGALRVRLSMDAGEFTKGIAQAQQQLQRVGKQMQAVGRQMAAALTLPLGLAGASILRTAADFEQGMANVKAVLRPTGDEFARLSALAEELGRTTKFTAREAADGMEMLARNGLKASQILGGAMQSTLDLASAAGADLQSVADVTTDIMNNFGMAASDLGGVVDQAAGVLVNSKLGWEDYAAAIGQASGVAGTLGMSLEDMNAGLAATASFFASGEEAGTSFKNAMVYLAGTSKETRETMTQLGLEFWDSSGNMKSMAEIAQQLQDKLSGLTVKGQAFVQAQIFGQRSMRTGMALMRLGAEGIERYKRLIADVSAEEMAADRLDTLTGAVLLLKSAWEGLAITIGKSGVKEAARGIVDGLTDFVRSMNDLHPAVLRFATALATVTAVVGPLLIAAGLAATALAALSTPLIAISAGVGAATALVIAFWPELKKLHEVATEAFRGLFESAVTWLEQKLQPVFETVQASVQRLADAFRWLLRQVGGEELVAAVDSGLSMAAGMIRSGASSAAEAVSSLAEKIAEFRAENAALAGQPQPSFRAAQEVGMGEAANQIRASMQGVGVDIEAANEAFRQLTERVQFFTQNLLDSPTATFAEKMQGLTEAVHQGAMGWREYASAVKMVHNESRQHLQDLASEVSTTLTAVFRESKTAAIASAIINTAQGVTQALGNYPPPFSFAMAALVAARGAAQIAAIRSTSKSGGGSSPSSGGGAAAPAAAAPVQNTLHITGMKPGEIYSYDQLRNLMERLVGMQRDGFKLVLANT